MAGLGSALVLAAVVSSTWTTRAAAQTPPPAAAPPPPPATATKTETETKTETRTEPVRPARRERPVDPTKLEWRYRTFQTGEYVATGIFGAVALGGLVIPTDEPRWHRGQAPSFDDRARDALRLESVYARKTADHVSDITLTASLNYVLFDSLIVAWLAHDKGSVAYQMTAIDFETIAISTGINSLVKGIVARQRPYGGECRKGTVLGRTDDCDTSELNRSFFSGHTSTAFTAASLSCIHHAYLPLYGGGAGDAAACFGAYTAAATTSVLRVMSDNHYLSDITVGAVFGTAVGLGVPWFFHYRHGAPPPEGVVARRDAVTFQLIPGPTSATVVGEF